MNRLAVMETFVRVVETGSFSAAAKHLNIGQPSISKSIARLEKRLGVRLLVRSTRGLTPTAAGRSFYEHNASVTLMRTTAAECAAMGAEMARKLAGSAATAVFVPRRGFSAIDRQGQPFDDPAAREALATALRAGSPLEIHELDAHLNDVEFARTMASRLLELMAKTGP